MKINKSNCLVIVPARFASSRFPGKPLAFLHGKTVIERVVTQVKKSGIDCVVATDDKRIAENVESFGSKYVLTSPDHQTGTDRIAEALSHLSTNAEIIINVQGDEPFILPYQILALANCFENKDIQIATLIKKFNSDTDIDVIRNPNIVKVVVDNSFNALYFSRSVIPYVRNYNDTEWVRHSVFYRHIGTYAFRREVLNKLVNLSPTSLEKAESLEQLRWLQSGYSIKTVVTDSNTISIDTPEDLVKAEKFISTNSELF